MPLPRVLCIMGSGETAPTMTSVHGELLDRLGPTRVPAVMLDTPFGFQENADDICARTVAYFGDSVRRDIEVASLRDVDTATPLEYERMCARLAAAKYVFAGPGSPTYAVRQWRQTRVPELLVEKLRSGGITVFASAAAVGLGELALPVYEIYKVGEAARWLPGLDLLRETGLRAVVIPHYSNAEGGTHDTRYCYMGERRMRVLEDMLPDGCAILGVDEHTACLIDLEAATMAVRGRGRVTWRVRGAEQSWGVGEVVPLWQVGAQLRTAVASSLADERGDVGRFQGGGVGEQSPFVHQVESSHGTAVRALEQRQVDGAVAAILDVESTLHEWSNDTLESDEPHRARTSLRELVVRLGDLAREGAADPRERIAPLVDAVLALREQARSERRFDQADVLRGALLDAGVEVQDTAHGSTWKIAGASSPSGRHGGD